MFTRHIGRLPVRALAGLFVSISSVAGCHGDTGPLGPDGQPLVAAVTITSPTENQIIADTLFQVQGVATAPGRITRVKLRFGTTELVLYKPVSLDSALSYVPFAFPLRRGAGTFQLSVIMEYMLPSDAAIQVFTSTVSARVYRKPVLRIESGLAPILYQRALTLAVSSVGIDSAPSLELVIDEGTPAQRRVSPRAHCDGVQYWPVCQTGLTTWTADVIDTLANGPHRLVLRLRDETGPVDSVVAGFVTQVDSRPYVLTALPGLNGADSDALDINSSDMVAGWARDAVGASHAVTWRNGTITPLPVSGTARESSALALNESGEAVGSVNDLVDTAYCYRAVRWPQGAWRFAGVNASSSFSTRPYCSQVAAGINVGGAIIVRPTNSADGMFATSWLVQGDVVTTLPSVIPQSVNDNADVVGLQSGGALSLPSFYNPTVAVRAPYVRAANVKHADILYSVNNSRQVIGLTAQTIFFSGTPGAEAVDLNPFLGSVVLRNVTNDGAILSFDPAAHTIFLWKAGRTTRVTLPAGGWTIDRVGHMNGAGVIVAHAIETSTGRSSAVILRPAA